MEYEREFREAIRPIDVLNFSQSEGKIVMTPIFAALAATRGYNLLIHWFLGYCRSFLLIVFRMLLFYVDTRHDDLLLCVYIVVVL